jgi:hypothetical protein
LKAQGARHCHLAVSAFKATAIRRTYCRSNSPDVLCPEVALNVRSQLHRSVGQPQLRGSPQVDFAESATEVRAAQALRHDIFAGEMGACLHNEIPGLDHDHLDPHCLH